MKNVKKAATILFLLILLAFVPLAGASEDDEGCLITDESCQVELGEGFAVPEDVVDIQRDKAMVIYFYGEGCPKCAEIEPFIDEIVKKYSDSIYIVKKEVYNNLDSYNFYTTYTKYRNIPLTQRKIPLIVIGSEYIMGISDVRKRFESSVLDAQPGCPEFGNKTCEDLAGTRGNIFSEILPITSLTWPIVIVAGLVDGVNPCAFAVMIFLLTYTFNVSANRRQMAIIAVAYIFAVYVTYFLAGMGLLHAIQLTGFSAIIIKIAAAVALITGVINLKDFFWYGKGITLKIPESQKGMIRWFTTRASVPSAIILGFLVSMFELPCTGGVYLAILALLSTSSLSHAIPYLAVYNLMFIAPLIAILLIMNFGMSGERLKAFKESKKSWMSLFMGVVLVALGVILLLAI